MLCSDEFKGIGLGAFMTYVTALSPYLQVETEEDREQVMSQL
jgi:hypothetical protein